MSILNEVEKALTQSEGATQQELSEALVNAERLSDLFSEVKPVPYVVPIERFAGMPVFDDQ